jgi:putative intracellular protease/amidase
MAAAPAPVGRQEAEAMQAALKPPKRERPMIAIIGINDATETTNYLVPYGILRRADVADVVLATRPGPVTLYPALKVRPDATVGEFDRRHHEGADYVIVPAMSRDDDPAALAWIRSQGGQGSDHHRHLRRSQGRRRRRTAGRQARDDPLVLAWGTPR